MSIAITEKESKLMNLLMIQVNLKKKNLNLLSKLIEKQLRKS